MAKKSIVEKWKREPSSRLGNIIDAISGRPRAVYRVRSLQSVLSTAGFEGKLPV